MGSGQRSVVGGQWSVVSGQWSVVSGQRSVVSGRSSVVDRQWSVVSGRWSVVDRQGSIVRGQWSVVSGQRIEPPSAAPSRPVNSGWGGSVFGRCFSLSCFTATESVAVHTLVPRARWSAWPERLRPCHWRLAMPGFPGVVLIPLGRLQMSPIPLLARGALLFHRPHPPAGGIHGTPKRRAEKANKAQEAS
jgi:hypothetical protein